MAVAKRCYRLGDQPLPRRVVSAPGAGDGRARFPRVRSRGESPLSTCFTATTIDSRKTSDKIVRYCSSTSHEE